MTLKPVPRFTAWLLARFLPDSEQDFIVGDILEQYQRGRSSLWCIRRVLGLLLTGRHAVWRRLLRARTPVSRAAGILIAVTDVVAAVLSAVSPLLGAGVFAGIVIAFLIQYSYDRTGPEVHDIPVARIDSSRIPAGGGIGSGILIVVLLAGVLLDLPSLRLMAAPGLLGGLVFAALLQLWRHVHPPRPRVVPLRLEDHP